MKKTTRSIPLTTLYFPLFVLPISLSAQNVGINTTTPAASAALDIAATDKGMFVPRIIKK